jgi:uncharacterized GH25 family protein
MGDARRLGLVLCSVAFVPTFASAHYPMLFPSLPSVQRGQHVQIRYQWGHPFEHQLFNALNPESLIVHTPEGKLLDLTRMLQKSQVDRGENKVVDAYAMDFVAQERGDYMFRLQLPAIWMEDDQEFLEDTASVVLHVQMQRGWDHEFKGTPERPEIRPLTRPYGLQPGMVFQTRVLAGNQALAGALVEIEHYNEAPPKSLPPDEQITRVVQADPNGVATGTLTDSGWTCFAAVREHGTRARDGKNYPVRQRAVFWTYVDPRP